MALFHQLSQFFFLADEATKFVFQSPDFIDFQVKNDS